MKEDVKDSKELIYSDKRVSPLILKLFVVFIIFLVLMVPLILVTFVITDRQHYKDIAIEKITQFWGSGQVFMGPVLTVPYENKKQKITSYIHFAPKDLNIKVVLKPKKKYIGIFEQTVYKSHLVIEGIFSGFDSYKNVLQDIKKEDIDWNSASISLDVSELKSIKSHPFVEIENTKLEFIPNSTDYQGYEPKIKALHSVNPKKKELPFKLELDLNGSNNFNITPIAQNNTISITSKWKHPSFYGNFIPDNKTINNSGFEAEWKISYLATNFPPVWSNSDISGLTTSNNLGVELLSPVNTYQSILRAVKYGVLFIALTFIVYFIFEIVGKFRIHPVQYSLMALPMVVFFLLLLSLAEIIEFYIAYIIASVATILLITLYTYFVVTRKVKCMYSIAMFVTLSILYAFLYLILRMQDHSLLAGSILLFIAIAVVMYVTRNINWYDEEKATVEDMHNG